MESPAAHFPDETKQVMLFDGGFIEDYVPEKGNKFSDYEAFTEIKSGFVEHIKSSKADLRIGYACNSLYKKYSGKNSRKLFTDDDLWKNSE